MEDSRRRQPTNILKIVLGVIGLLSVVIWLQNAYAGYGAAALSGLFVAASCWALFTGVLAAIRGKPASLGLSMLAPVVVLVMCTVSGPTISNAFMIAEEESEWQQLVAAATDPDFDPASWTDTYETLVAERHRRDGWQDKRMNALVHIAVRSRDAIALQVAVAEIDASSETEAYARLRTTAVKTLEEIEAADDRLPTKWRGMRLPVGGASSIEEDDEYLAISYPAGAFDQMRTRYKAVLVESGWTIEKEGTEWLSEFVNEELVSEDFMTRVLVHRAMRDAQFAGFVLTKGDTTMLVIVQDFGDGETTVLLLKQSTASLLARE